MNRIKEIAVAEAASSSSFDENFFSSTGTERLARI
jgi:hypothetical protein